MGKILSIIGIILLFAACVIQITTNDKHTIVIILLSMHVVVRGIKDLIINPSKQMIAYAKIKCKEQREICSQVDEISYRIECSEDDKEYREAVKNAKEPNW